MVCFRSRRGLGLALLLVAVSWAGVPASAAPQAPGGERLAFKSVHGKLETVDKRQGGIIMRSDDGKRLAWRFDKRVIEAASAFQPGDAIVVIYRQTGGDKTVTAVAFPGATTTPVYLNTTGDRVEFVSGPAADGVCGKPGADTALNQSTMPVGGMAEVSDACWCCAPAGETCAPANKTGLGKALLVRCLK
jgi:hypothetical protein